jgi:enterochelin esterase family protein
MIVVMPNGRAGGGPANNRSGQEFANFEKNLIGDVIPYVEAHYSVQADREHRALAGLSMGGGQTTRVLTTHPDQFAYVAIWSAGLFGGDPAAYEKQNAAFFKDAERVNKSVKLLEISVGDKDFALNGSKALDELFTKHGIRHKLTVTGGGHTWINWRHYLNELAPKLFR